MGSHGKVMSRDYRCTSCKAHIPSAADAFVHYIIDELILRNCRGLIGRQTLVSPGNHPPPGAVRSAVRASNADRTAPGLVARLAPEHSPWRRR